MKLQLWGVTGSALLCLEYQPQRKNAYEPLVEWQRIKEDVSEREQPAPLPPYRRQTTHRLNRDWTQTFGVILIAYMLTLLADQRVSQCKTLLHLSSVECLE